LFFLLQGGQLAGIAKVPLLICKQLPSTGSVGGFFLLQKKHLPNEEPPCSRHPELDSGSVKHSATTYTDTESSSGGRWSLRLSKGRLFFCIHAPFDKLSERILFVAKKTPPQRRTAIQAVIPNLIRDL
jgi:hypothetical protein